MKKKYRAFSVTGGVGSMLIGTKSLGFDIVGGVEWRTYYDKEVFEKYFNVPFVRKLEEFPGGIPKNIDLAMGHPNCGAFSILNKNCRDDHKKAMDIPLFVEMISKVKPKFFAMDNLPMSLKEAFTIEKYKELLPEYDLFPEWISNYHYGNIQEFRRRFFLIGAKKELNFVFVPGEMENELRVRDALKGLPLREDIKDINHIHSLPNSFTSFRDMKGNKMTIKQVASAILKIPSGKPLQYKNFEGKIKKKFGYFRNDWDKFAYVILGGETGFHPETGWPLTIRERARIQGCPDDFIFYGPYHHQLKQTGKFMPVQFPKYLSKQILSFLEKKPFKSSGKRLIKPSPYVDNAKLNYCKKFGYKNQNRVCQNCWLGDRCSLKSFDLLK